MSIHENSYPHTCAFTGAHLYEFFCHGCNKPLGWRWSCDEESKAYCNPRCAGFEQPQGKDSNER